MRYSCHALSALRGRFRELAAITGGRDQAEYRQFLRSMAQAGLHVWIAEDKGRIAGSLGFTPEPGRLGVRIEPQLALAVEAAGQNMGAVQVRTLIYVSPEYRGHGIASALEARADEQAAQMGFRHVLAYGFDSPEISQWLARHGNAIELGVSDPSGLPCFLVPIGAEVLAAPDTVLALLRRDFTYSADGVLDAWEIHRRPGPVTGDCEDFALALAWRLAGCRWPPFLWHLLTCKSVVWHTTSRAGIGHAVLWHRGAGWADNISPHWTPRTVHRRRFPWGAPLLILKLAAGPLFAWVNSTVNRAIVKKGMQ
ncbi:GNAT family N-acetyltransferase [Leisingera sp. NJS201]|uniref:GNAT family N-acetyltransferase n=1 Tax=Leisingera sp. NJS201 TaxID=2508306 RepID=UPI00107122DC|nr:GNAT family N-acetyltransferase [Leisingera sp. NJS201]QBR35416.1 GNAT family N-acetyltransferase [Leisingera sp. NJS201]